MNPEITQIITSVLGVIATLVLLWGVALLQKWTGLKLTDQQEKTIKEAIEYISGQLILDLTTGTLKINDLHANNEQVIKVAAPHLTQDVVDALKARDMTVSQLCLRAVAKTGHSPATQLAAPALSRMNGV